MTLTDFFNKQNKDWESFLKLLLARKVLRITLMEVKFTSLFLKEVTKDWIKFLKRVISSPYETFPEINQDQ